jgi:hypothetical protein
VLTRNEFVRSAMSKRNSKERKQKRKNENGQSSAPLHLMLCVRRYLYVAIFFQKEK